jgi:hypothetical protein
LAWSATWLASADLVLRERDLFLAAQVLRLAAAVLCVQLGDFEHGECLAGANAVADIDIDMAHVAGDLRMHIDHLIGLKLAGKTQHMGDVAALDFTHGSSDLRVGIRGTTSVAAGRYCK